MTSEDHAKRLGEMIRQRRKALKLTQADVQKKGGPSTATLRLIEGGRHTDFRPSTSIPLEHILGWAGGSIDNILAGGEPIEPVNVPAPKLHRGAPNAPVMGQLDRALGVHPLLKGQSLPMSHEHRRLLSSARNKLLHNVPLNDDEGNILATFIEDDELRTLHVRIDWLPRPEQLEVSQLVNDLAERVDHYARSFGVTNETEYEDLPSDYPWPNPLPVEGVPPDLRDFPSQVPTYIGKGVEDDITSKPAVEGGEGETPPHEKTRAADGRQLENKPDALTSHDQGDSTDGRQSDYQLAGRDTGGISEGERTRRRQDEEAERGDA